jgi:hypothetical protein
VEIERNELDIKKGLVLRKCWTNEKSSKRFSERKFNASP